MADVRVHAFDATLSDATDPVPDSVDGPLAAPGAHAGTESVAFSATDTGAGVYRGMIEVRRSGQALFAPVVTRVLDANGGRCQDAGADSSTPYEFLHRVPCRLAVSTSLDLDTTTLPDGVHELRVRVEDASGNSATVHGPVPFEVDNVPPPAVADPDGTGPASGLPSISGTPVVGNTLVGERGSWSGDGLAYAQQWLRCTSATDPAACVPIAGATGSGYRLASADLSRFLRFRVTASNGEGSASAVSAAKGPVTSASGDGSGGAAAPPVLGPPNNGTNASNRAVITLSSKRRRTVRYGKRVRSVATLRDEHGRAIAGARVAVLQRSRLPGAQWTVAREPLTTDADGRLRWRVPAGHSRTVRYAYKANLRNTRFQATSDLALSVRSKTTLRPSRRFLRNGQKLRLGGRLRSRPIPAGGVLIDVQARVGRRWQTFQTARTRSRGRWSIGYRFRSTRGLQTYAFRARVRQDSGYPYAASRSKTVRVRVAG